jgi:CheY-like chemotaxis protein
MALEPTTILLVEDDAGLRYVFSRILRSAGYDVLEAATADEAEPTLRGDRPVDLLLTDLLMPGRLDGLDLAQLAGTLRPRLKVLFTTAYSGPSFDEAQAISAGKVLRKPFAAEELLRVVSGTLGIVQLP